MVRIEKIGSGYIKYNSQGTNRMCLGTLSMLYFRIIAVLLAVLIVVPVNIVSAAQPNTGGTNFDIPISELNKVKKKTTSKRILIKSKKKIVDAEKLESSSKTTSPTDPAGKTQIQPVVPDNVVQLETTPKAAEQFQESEKVQTHHSPYSFVVAGKRTIIHAVINSKADILEVNCILREADGREQTQVKMEKVTGTRFTFMASLPGQLREGSSLRYNIVVVDSQGTKTRSQEFVTPVTSSPVVPSWQVESPAEVLPAEKADGPV